MQSHRTRGIVVIDVGSTNVKALLFDDQLIERASLARPAKLIDQKPYRCIDIKPAIEFAMKAIVEFDNILPVDAIVPCSHGSSLALLDSDGGLAMPIMSYQAKPPDEVNSAYSEIEPPFDEVFAPTNPDALTLGRQLFWQEEFWPEEFKTVQSIVPLAQYVSLRLCGEAASEVSALGAQTHLWNPKANTYSSLAIDRGWDGLFAPIHPAWEPLARLTKVKLRGRGEVLTGVHDSNANFYRYQSKGAFTLLSTGTWIIAFDPSVPLDSLDGNRDQVSNTTVAGEAVSCCRYMGGQEFSLVAQNATPSLASLDEIGALIERGVFALPAFTNSGGPLPSTGGRGIFVGPAPATPSGKSSLAALYTAQMTAIALEALGTTGKVIVDGPFAHNAAYLDVLLALMPQCRLSAQLQSGTALGAAMLALAAGGHALPDLPESNAVDQTDIPNIMEYHQDWLTRALSQTR